MTKKNHAFGAVVTTNQTVFFVIFTKVIIVSLRPIECLIDWEKNRKTFFDFLSSWLEINVSLFCLGQFEEVGSELGSPEAGVEIGTG